jgi:hypothetical protein
MADTPHQIKCSCAHSSHGSVPCGNDVDATGSFCKMCKEKHVTHLKAELLGRVAHNAFGPKFDKVQHYCLSSRAMNGPTLT